ncbi:hypothetical protein ACJ6WF_18790 [Streptomyces sp. MMS24-I2-30]|uniref:hypothetical protein n=1 Tax=Streptomyces sp. MMS24-I2-30 TaxID=3351564 RepID=UPI003896B3A3
MSQPWVRPIGCREPWTDLIRCVVERCRRPNQEETTVPRPGAADLTEAEKKFREETRSIFYENDSGRDSVRETGGALEKAWQLGYESGYKNHQIPYSKIHNFATPAEQLAQKANDNNHENHWNPGDWVRHMHGAGYEFGALEKKYGSRDAALQKKIDMLWQPGNRPVRPERSAALAVRRTANRLATRFEEMTGSSQNRDTRDTRDPRDTRDTRDARAAEAPLGSRGAARESTERLLSSAASVASSLREETGTEWSRPATPTRQQSATTAAHHINVDLGPARKAPAR